MDKPCNCGRLDLGKWYGIVSFDPKLKERGSHTEIQCYDRLNRKLKRRQKED